MSDEKEWKEVGGQDGDLEEIDWTKLQVGQSVEGKYEKSIQPKTANNPSYLIRVGEKLRGFGSTVLNSKFSKLEPGCDVKIERVEDGKSEESGRSYENYQVFTV